jgi:hypothetical protein
MPENFERLHRFVADFPMSDVLDAALPKVSNAGPGVASSLVFVTLSPGPVIQPQRQVIAPGWLTGEKIVIPAGAAEGDITVADLTASGKKLYAMSTSCHENLWREMLRLAMAAAKFASGKQPLKATTDSSSSSFEGPFILHALYRAVAENDNPHTRNCNRHKQVEHN